MREVGRAPAALVPDSAGPEAGAGRQQGKEEDGSHLGVGTEGLGAAWTRHSRFGVHLAQDGFKFLECLLQAVHPLWGSILCCATRADGPWSPTTSLSVTFRVLRGLF